MQLSQRVGEISLELVVVVLAEARGNQRACLRRAHGLAGAGFGKDDVPEIGVRRSESDADKATLPFFAQGSDVTLGGLGGHFIENADVLTGNQGRIHEQKGPVRADHVSRGLQINGFAFGQAATHLKGNLKGKSNRAPTLRVACSLHAKAFWKGAYRFVSDAGTKSYERQGHLRFGTDSTEAV